MKSLNPIVTVFLFCLPLVALGAWLSDGKKVGTPGQSDYKTRVGPIGSAGSAILDGKFTSRNLSAVVLSPDYIITGTITPDMTGNYTNAGTWGGSNYYTVAGSKFLSWYSVASRWEIGETLAPVAPEAHWRRTGTITGTYTAASGAS